MAGGPEGLVVVVVAREAGRWKSKEEQRLGRWGQLLGQRAQWYAHLQPVIIIIKKIIILMK